MEYYDKYMNSIYEKIDRNIAHPFRDIERVKEVYTKIEQQIERERPNPEEFRGIISDKEIDEDIERVAELEEIWEKTDTEDSMEVKMKATIAEYIIYKNLGAWMNQIAVPLITAKADDYIRGIDLVIESENDLSENANIEHLGVGIDVALASERSTSESVDKKTKKVRNILKSGKMGEARYVTGGSYEGKIQNLPYTILSISPSHIEDLFSSVLRKDQSEKEKTHILKHVVAYQIVLQLGTYYNEAEKLGHEVMAYEIGLANNFAVEIFGPLIEELRTNPELWEKVQNDAGTKEIIEFCNSF